MSPSLTEILTGAAAAMMSPPSPDAGPAYAASRLGMVGMMTMLAAQEAERGPAAAVAENAAIRALFVDAGAYDADGALAKAAAMTDADFSGSGLDRANADLRNLLITLHERVEDAGDGAMDRRILALYCDMARGRRLSLGR